MAFNRFRLQVLLRVVALFATTALCIYMWWTSSYILTSLLCTAVVGVQFYYLLHYVERTNRELERFFMSIAYDDFSQSFLMPKLGGSFHELGKAFERVMEHFRKTRQSKEEAAQFSNIVMQQVPVAVMVIEGDGKLLMINRKARKLFGNQPLKTVDELRSLDSGLADYLGSADSGSRKLVTATINHTQYQLMVSVTRFIAGDSVKKIVCLQNIRSELDRQEVQAWQDLIRVLSHEIMNSITPITSLSHSAGEMLRSRMDTETAADVESLKDIACAIETIARRSDGLLGFVERYRQVARLPEPTLCKVNLDKLLEQFVQLMHHEMEDKKVTLELVADPGLPEISADEQMINQAVINLLRNALDAVKDVAEPYIRINASRGFDGQLTISVADNGCGISPQELQKIWIPFYTTKGNGSGVGLSLVRQIAHAHGGTVSVHSTEGEGTRVEMHISISSGA